MFKSWLSFEFALYFCWKNKMFPEICKICKYDDNKKSDVKLDNIEKMLNDFCASVSDFCVT